MDEWDSIDWDEKVEDIIKSQEKLRVIEDSSSSDLISSPFKITEEDGNYFDSNRQKVINKQKAGTSKPSVQAEQFIQAYSLKDLARIRGFATTSQSFHNLIYETFGKLERFLLTHNVDLTHEMIVELLIIDTALLEVPFYSHNQMLLKAVSKISSFWSQLVDFIKEFLESKHRDMKFLLSVDMNGFFNNLVIMMNNLLVNNLFTHDMEIVLVEILNVMDGFGDSEWSRTESLRNVLESSGRDKNVQRIFDVSTNSD